EEADGDWLLEKIRLDHALPHPWPGQPLDRGLERCQRALVDVVPDRPHAADEPGLVDNRLGAVVDHEDETQGEHQQPEKPENKSDHGVTALRDGKISISRYRLSSSPVAINRRHPPTTWLCA